MQALGYTYTKKYIIYQKFKFNWTSCVLFVWGFTPKIHILVPYQCCNKLLQMWNNTNLFFYSSVSQKSKIKVISQVTPASYFCWNIYYCSEPQVPLLNF